MAKITVYIDKLAEDLKKLIERGRYSQHELGVQCGLSQSQISKILGGVSKNLSLSSLVKICLAKGLKPEDYVPPEYLSTVKKRQESMLPRIYGFGRQAQGVLSYHFRDGIIYIGVPKSFCLEDACMASSKLVAERASQSKSSATDVELEIYREFRDNGALFNLEIFSPLEAIAIKYLGKARDI